MIRHTKIIATIGPVSIPLPILKRMVSSGMNIARINTKYGNDRQYLEIISNLKKLNDCEILFDIKGTEILKWLKTQEFDYLAVSFAETASQIRKTKKILSMENVKLVSKIETRKGIENIDQLIEESDGIMVARGDLGRHIPIEQVPLFQKLIIKKCNKKDKMAITATEMLLSMTKLKSPTRAEVADVANAVLDGSGALMLSEETAIGKYPALSVKTMAKIIKEVELWQEKKEALI